MKTSNELLEESLKLQLSEYVNQALVAADSTNKTSSQTEPDSQRSSAKTNVENTKEILEVRYFFNI